MAAAPDRRRFTGPETSWPIRYVRPAADKPSDVNAEDRADGRNLDQMRPIYLKTGLVPRANGSAYIETGKTKIICAVYGPQPARKDAPYSAKAKLNVEVKFTPFASLHRRRAPGRDTESNGLAAQVTQALLPSLRLDLLPKSAIDLYITILENDGPLDNISAGITAASVALAEAGVQMYGIVVGCSGNLVIRGDKQQLLIDATHEESLRSHGLVSVACMPALSSTTTLSISGKLSAQMAKETLKQLQNEAVKVHSVAARALLEGKKVPVTIA